MLMWISEWEQRNGLLEHRGLIARADFSIGIHKQRVRRLPGEVDFEEVLKTAIINYSLRSMHDRNDSQCEGQVGQVRGVLCFRECHIYGFEQSRRFHDVRTTATPSAAIGVGIIL